MRFVPAVASVLLLAAPLAASAPPADDRPDFFDYLHVEASSGNASGGHTAICFGDRCFHFQQGSNRTIQLHRESAARFDHSYRALGNRTVHAYRAHVSAQVRADLLEAFEATYRRQRRDFEGLEVLQEDDRFLEQLAGASRGAARGAQPFRVPGSAYFLATVPSSAATPAVESGRALGAGGSSAIERIAHRVRERYGSRCLETRAIALNAAIRNLLAGPELAPSTEAGPEDESLPPGVAGRYRELLSAWLAVEVLRAVTPLRPGSMVRVPAPHNVWAPSEWEAIDQFRARLEGALVELFGSKRHDWGYPMLIGLARIAALEHATARRELVVLDVFREDAEVVPATEVKRHRGLLSEILLERLEDLAAARAAFVADPNELRFSRLETAANLAAELAHALDQGGPLRVHQDAPVPVKSAVRGDWPRPHVAPATLERLIAIAQARSQRAGDELASAYAYDLVRRNCVTEILDVLDAKGLGRGGGAGAPADDPRVSGASFADALRFIPFVSASVVRNRLGASRLDRPSYRRLVLARMERSESQLLVDLRESNVLTSTIYQPNLQDPLFLFFTDDAVLSRPLRGMANVTVAVGAAVAGVVLAPVDGGTTFRRALAGIASSLPEIFFVSLRKGSFPFAPHRWLEVDGAIEPRTSP